MWCQKLYFIAKLNHISSYLTLSNACNTSQQDVETESFA